MQPFDQTSTSPTAVGTELEVRVATFYEALGYRVTRNVQLNGHQIDLLASKYMAPSGRVSTAIEVKHRTTEAVGETRHDI